MKKILPVLGLLVVATSSLHAETIDTKQIYFGGGIGLNDYRNDNATGFQLFAGLPIQANMGKAALAVELGYMDSGNFNGGASADGIWSTAVVSYPLQDNLKLVGRAGYDFGDDDGLMLGGGLGVAVANNMDMRFEYVIRNNIDSLQANLVIRQ